VFYSSQRFEKRLTGCKGTPVQIRGGPATVDGAKVHSISHWPKPAGKASELCREPGNLACWTKHFPRGLGGRARPNFPARGLGIFLMQSKNIIGALMLLAAGGALLLCCRESRKMGGENLRPRIVSLAPSLTEIVFMLGMGDHLVGVTDHCNYPSEAKSKPRLGGLKTISLEAVISRNPDIILGTEDGNEQSLLDQLRELHFRLYTFQPRTLDEVLTTILAVSRVCGRESRGQELVKELKSRQEMVSKAVAGSGPVPAVLVFEHEPLILAGPGTFAHDLIEKAGGKNLADDARIPYPRYSLELLIAKSPEVIIDVAMGEDANAEQKAWQYWSQWPDIPAVRNRKVAVLDSDLVTRPGPRLFQSLVQLAGIFHPECFGKGK